MLIDTSQSDGCLLAFDQNYKIVFSSYWTHPLRHTEQLLSEFKKCKSFLDLHELDNIYFVSGPGSFTGLRVGASFVKTVGLIYKDVPIYCINSFKTTALHVQKKLNVRESFSVCISSIGSMVFKADYEFIDKVFQTEIVFTEGAIKFEKSSKQVFSPNSNIEKKFPEINSIKIDTNDYLAAVKELDQNKFLTKTYTHLDLYPLYLRKSEAEEKYRYDKVKL